MLQTPERQFIVDINLDFRPEEERYLFTQTIEREGVKKVTKCFSPEFDIISIIEV